MSTHDPVVRKITRTTTIEDLIAASPGSVRLFVRHGLPCLTCGEPVWGTVEEVVRVSGKKEPEIDALVEELNGLRTVEMRSSP